MGPDVTVDRDDFAARFDAKLAELHVPATVREQITAALAIQTPACDRCTQGVMDVTNDHLWGRCRCECHGRQS